jgi:hypothetical protein
MASGGNTWPSDLAHYRGCRVCHKPYLWPTDRIALSDHERTAHPRDTEKARLAARILSRAYSGVIYHEDEERMGRRDGL